MIEYLLAVDPGLESPGAAIFMHGVLTAAADIDVPKVTGVPHGQRALIAANAIVSWATSIVYTDLVTIVAHEWPKVYPCSRVDPNDLIGMAAVDGAVDCAFALIASSRGMQLEVRTFLPAEWAGQLPKDTRKGRYWSSPRGVRIKSRLTNAEWQIAKDVGHDGGDSVGIGLHALGRLGVRRALATK